MRVRDHILLSSVASVLAWPWLHQAVAIPWASSILLDIDHYLFFCWHRRQLSPRGAIRFFNQAQPPRHCATRLLHSPFSLLPLLAGRRRHLATLLAFGVVFHLALDTYHELKTQRARRAALARDRFICQRCGARDPSVVAHLREQPTLLPSYHLIHYTSLCAACHEAAHVLPVPRGGLNRPRRGRGIQ